MSAGAHNTLSVFQSMCLSQFGLVTCSFAHARLHGVGHIYGTHDKVAVNRPFGQQFRMEAFGVIKLGINLQIADSCCWISLRAWRGCGTTKSLPSDISNWGARLFG